MNVRAVLIGTVCTLLGVGAGFAGGYFLSKKKYLAMAEKEISSVKKVYEKHFKQPQAEPVQPKEKKPLIGKLVKPESEKKNNLMTPYNEIYSPDEKVESVVETPTPRKVKPSNDNIVVIDPDDFQTSTYEVETLYYFADKVLTDSDYNVINNVVELIGPEALNTFGRYLNDTVYVRDRNKKIDYEIIWDSRKHSNVIKNRGSKSPLPEEDEE